MDKTYEGVVRIGAAHVEIEHDGQRIELAEPNTGVFKLVDGCHVRATTRDNKVVRLQLKGANCAYTEVGPIQTVTGTRTIQNGPPGSKLADSPSDYFDADGVRYGVAGGAKPEVGKQVSARVRVLKANMAYVARSSEADVWFED